MDPQSLNYKASLEDGRSTHLIGIHLKKVLPDFCVFVCFLSFYLRASLCKGNLHG